MSSKSKKPEKKKADKSKKKPEPIKIETIKARHDFGPDEKQQLGASLATKVHEKARLTEEKKVATKEWSNKLEVVQNEINSISDKISSGFEFRDTDCEVHYDWKKGTKTFVRISDKKEVETRKIDDTERQQRLWEEDRERKKSEPKPGEPLNVAAAVEKAEKESEETENEEKPRVVSESLE